MVELRRDACALMGRRERAAAAAASSTADGMAVAAVALFAAGATVADCAASMCAFSGCGCAGDEVTCWCGSSGRRDGDGDRDRSGAAAAAVSVAFASYAAAPSVATAATGGIICTELIYGRRATTAVLMEGGSGCRRNPPPGQPARPDVTVVGWPLPPAVESRADEHKRTATMGGYEWPDAPLRLRADSGHGRTDSSQTRVKRVHVEVSNRDEQPRNMINDKIQIVHAQINTPC